MTIVVELEDPEEWFNRESIFDVKTFKCRRFWGQGGARTERIILSGYIPDRDTIFRADIEPNCEIKNEDIVKSELKNDTVMGEVIYKFENIGKFTRRHLVDNEGDFHKDPTGKHFNGKEEQERLRDQIREKMKERGIIEGEIKGSAQEIFVEIE